MRASAQGGWSGADPRNPHGPHIYPVSAPYETTPHDIFPLGALSICAVRIFHCVLGSSTDSDRASRAAWPIISQMVKPETRRLDASDPK